MGVLLALIGMIGFLFGLLNLIRPLGKLQIDSRRDAGFLIGASFLVFLFGGMLLPGTPDAVPEAGSTSTTATTAGEAMTSTTVGSTTPDQVTTTTAGVSTTSEPVVVIPGYEVVEEADVSGPGAVRISLRVTVEEGATPNQIRLLALQLQDMYRDSHQYQALAIFFYHYPELAFL